MKCSVDGCDAPRVAKGYCSKHWKRWHRHGDPLLGRTPNGEAERFVRETILIYQGAECLIWPFARNSNGYAKIWLGGRIQYVHRLVCEAVNGPPPDPDHEASHTCGNGALGCVSPAHLVWKTHAGNCADTIVHGTSLRGLKNPNAVLSPEYVRAIRLRYGQGEPARALAQEFGISIWSIFDVASRRSWGWLNDQ